MRRFLTSIVAAIVLSGLLSSVSLAGLALPSKPAADIYVQDYAHLLSDTTRASILKEGAALDRETTAQIAVVTIDSLNGATVEEYALELARNWGVGQKDKDNGVLILVAKEDRKARIEVGYGLEGRITDARAGTILRDMTAQFKRNDYDGGILAAFRTLAQLARAEASATGDVAPPSVQASNQDGTETLVVALAILLSALVLVGLLEAWLASADDLSPPSSRPRRKTRRSAKHPPTQASDAVLATTVLHRQTNGHDGEEKERKDDDERSDGGFFGGSSGGFGGGSFGGGGASGGW